MHAGSIRRCSARSCRRAVDERPKRAARPASMYWPQRWDTAGIASVALRKSPAAAIEARRRARLQARKEGRQVSAGTLAAAEWIILVTSLSAETFVAADILKLYRMRWRIELAFKRLKSLIGLRSPPAQDPRLARLWVLSHLIMILLTEPLIDELGVSPSRARADRRSGVSPDSLSPPSSPQSFAARSRCTQDQCRSRLSTLARSPRHRKLQAMPILS